MDFISITNKNYEYFCLDFVSINDTRWQSQNKIVERLVDFISVKHAGLYPNFWILFPRFANLSSNDVELIGSWDRIWLKAFFTSETDFKDGLKEI